MAERRFATDSDEDDKMYTRAIGDLGGFDMGCDVEDDIEESLPSRNMSPARTYTQGDPPLGSPYPDDVYRSDSSSDLEAAASKGHSQLGFQTYHATLPKRPERLIPDSQDLTVCQTMDTLKQMIQQYAEGFSALPAASDPLSHVLQPQHAEAIRYVGCLALGGPDGTDSWKQLLQNSGAHKALIFGIIARALKEHVFGALWFGATPQQEKELNKIQEDLLDKDGKGTELCQPTAMKVKLMKLQVSSERELGQRGVKNTSLNSTKKLTISSRRRKPSSYCNYTSFCSLSSPSHMERKGTVPT